MAKQSWKKGVIGFYPTWSSVSKGPCRVDVKSAYVVGVDFHHLCADYRLRNAKFLVWF